MLSVIIRRLTQVKKNAGIKLGLAPPFENGVPNLLGLQIKRDVVIGCVGNALSSINCFIKRKNIEIKKTTCNIPW